MSSSLWQNIELCQASFCAIAMLAPILMKDREI